MKTTSRLILSLMILAAMLLSACGAAQTPVATQGAAPREEIPQEATTEEAVEQPALESESQTEGENTYPGPRVVEYSAPVPYPTPVEAETVEWSEMLDFVKNGDVAQVLQTTDLTIVITLDDGTIHKTTAPSKDEIFRLLEECGEVCNDIIRLTEW